MKSIRSFIAYILLFFHPSPFLLIIPMWTSHLIRPTSQQMTYTLQGSYTPEPPQGAFCLRFFLRFFPSLSLSSSSLFILPSFGGWWVHGPVGGSAIPAPSLIIFPPACVRVCVCVADRKSSSSDWRRLISIFLQNNYHDPHLHVEAKAVLRFNRVPPVGLDDPFLTCSK